MSRDDDPKTPRSWKLPDSPWSRPFRLFYLDHQAFEEISVFKAQQLDLYDSMTDKFGHPIGFYERHDHDWALYLRDHPKQTIILASLLARAVVDMVECPDAVLTFVVAFDPPQRLTDSPDAIGVYALGECADAINSYTINCTPILRSIQHYIDQDENAALLRAILDELNHQLARFGYSWSLTNSIMGNCFTAIRLAPERPIVLPNQQVSGRCIEMNDGGLVWWVGQALQNA